MFKLDLEKAEEPVIKLPTSTGSWKKQESSRKTPTSALLSTPKPLTVWITTNCGKFLKRWECQTTWPASWEICIEVKATVRTGHGTTDWFQIRKEVHQGCILSPCLCNLSFFTFMHWRRKWQQQQQQQERSTSWKILDWKKHKLESRLPGEISITSDDTTLMAESEEELKSL